MIFWNQGQLFKSVTDTLILTKPDEKVKPLIESEN